jgi:hypothetical protein
VEYNARSVDDPSIVRTQLNSDRISDAATDCGGLELLTRQRAASRDGPQSIDLGTNRTQHFTAWERSRRELELSRG